MKHDLAWNRGEQCVSWNTEWSVRLHIWLATVSHQTLFHLTSLPLYEGSAMTWNSVWLETGAFPWWAMCVVKYWLVGTAAHMACHCFTPNAVSSHRASCVFFNFFIQFVIPVVHFFSLFNFVPLVFRWFAWGPFLNAICRSTTENWFFFPFLFNFSLYFFYSTIMKYIV